MKDEGNKCMNSKEYINAISYYTKGLLIVKNDITLLSNRSEAYLRMGYFMSALRDCDNILKINPNHEKSLYRKARALENIRPSNIENLKEAIDIYNKLINNENKDIINYRIDICNNKFNNLNGFYKSKDMIEEEKNIINEINCCRIYNSSIKESNFSDYINKKIHKTYDNKKGVFLIATETIKQGELLIVEKALTYVFVHEYEKFKNEMKFSIPNNEYYDSQYEIYQLLERKLEDEFMFKEKNNIEYLSQLYNNNSDKNLDERIKSFKKDDIANIIKSNAILTIRNDNIDYKDVCYGIWYMTSFINHSCLPNAYYYGIGPYIIIKTIKDINQGEEISISYVEPKPFDERTYSLNKWNFNCICDLCINENLQLENKNYKYINKKLDKVRINLLKNYITSYDQMKYFFNKNGKNLKTKFIKWIKNILNLNYDSFISFIFYKQSSIIISYTDDDELKCILYEKAYEIIKNISIREGYDILLNYNHFCSSILSKEKLKWLSYELEYIRNIILLE